MCYAATSHMRTVEGLSSDCLSLSLSLLTLLCLIVFSKIFRYIGFKMYTFWINLIILRD